MVPPDRPGRGGARRGAGRKPVHPILKKFQIGIKLPQWMIDWLAEESARTDLSRAEVVEHAIMRTHKLKPPKVDT